MNSQAKALIPALIGIVALLLAGVTGTDLPRVSRQATEIVDTRTAPADKASHQGLGASFRRDADEAVRALNNDIAAHVAITFGHQPAIVVAQNPMPVTTVTGAE